MPRQNPGQIVRQELVFVEFNERKPDTLSRQAKPIKLPDMAIPSRVWTLYSESDPAKPPELPFLPVHNRNAFLEDWVHDWITRDGHLIYYSRVTETPMWLLLEYRESPTRSPT